MLIYTLFCMVGGGVNILVSDYNTNASLRPREY